METVASVLETVMIVSFGVSWPLNLMKAYRSRCTGGKSVLFDYFILLGYICGVISKIMTRTYNLAFYFYFPNITMVTLDILLYYRNRALEQAGKP